MLRVFFSFFYILLLRASGFLIVDWEIWFLSSTKFYLYISALSHFISFTVVCLLPVIVAFVRLTCTLLLDHISVVFFGQSRTRLVICVYDHECYTYWTWCERLPTQIECITSVISRRKRCGSRSCAGIIALCICFAIISQWFPSAYPLCSMQRWSC